ncbi:MAG: hypothetical protein J5708_01170 [Bacteroidales bacterium]|nr:hypothetical protein [Bacteroidales bacterium]
MIKQLEKPFEFLKRKDGSDYSPEIINNWYIARAYVLDRLKDIAFGCNANKHLHVVIGGDSAILLAVARQVALSAHFINNSRTVITLISSDTNIIDKIEQEEYLCNLPKYCKVTVNGECNNYDSYTDVELQILNEWHSDDDDCIMVTEKDIEDFCQSKQKEDIFSIDTRKAVLTGRVYTLGTDFKNLSAEDIYNAQRYTQSLNAFQYYIMEEKMMPMMSEKDKQLIVKEKLSNIICSDCFETRAKEVALIGKANKNDESVWEDCNEALSKSEHDRWVVEKLIMGYRPLNQEERMHDEQECLTKEMKRQYRKQLKSNPQDPAYIDLCSYNDLRRIKPDDLKYDSFLMLAIPKILKKVNK